MDTKSKFNSSDCVWMVNISKSFSGGLKWSGFKRIFFFLLRTTFWLLIESINEKELYVVIFHSCVK